jgi:TolA-binding protein
MMRRMSYGRPGLLLALAVTCALFVASSAQAVNPAQHAARLGCNGNGGTGNRPTAAQAQQMAIYQAQMQQMQMQQLQAYQQLQQAAIYQAQMQAAAAQRARQQQQQPQQNQSSTATASPFAAPARTSAREKPEGKLSVTASRIDSTPVEEVSPEQKAQRAEEIAAGKLKLAKMLVQDGREDKAAVRLQEIIDAYPDTKAAGEAKELLAKVCK